MKNVPIPQGSSFEFMQGNKIVLETTDTITAKSDVASSLDIALTIMEITQIMSSNLKVNTILPSTGDTVSIAGIASITSSVSIASSCTATTFYGSGVNLTSLPAGNLTGALPAIDGSNLTGITGTTINNNANNRVITGSGTANTLEGESTLTFDGTQLHVNAGAGSNVQADGTGSYGQFSGVKVWMGLNSRAHNTVVGNGALGSATGGDDCTAVGHNAYQNGTSGTDNTAIGSHCMVGTVTGNRNCGLGHGALNKLTSGYDNTGLGRLAGLEMLGGYNNTYVGSSAGEKTIGANNNTFLGYKAGLDITTGNQNVAVGSYAFNKQTETSFNVAIGHYSQHWSSTNSAGNNVSIGHEALRGASNASPLTLSLIHI